MSDIAKQNIQDFLQRVPKPSKTKKSDEYTELTWTSKSGTLAARFLPDGNWHLVFPDRIAEGFYPSGAGHFAVRIEELML